MKESYEVEDAFQITYIGGETLYLGRYRELPDKIPMTDIWNIEYWGTDDHMDFFNDDLDDESSNNHGIQNP
jgi:hypothetical protein